jgi:hypothetical protein
MTRGFSGCGAAKKVSSSFIFSVFLLRKKKAARYNPTFDGKRDSSTSGTGPLKTRALPYETATSPQGLHPK